MTVDARESGARFAFPNPLPKPPPRGMRREPIAARFRVSLRTFFARRPDVLVAGMGYVCADLDDPERWVVPDAVVAFGVDPEAIQARNGYVISEVGKPPDFVLDIALGKDSIAAEPPDFVSGMSLNEDHALKRDIYAGFGVLESWLFAAVDSERRADQRPLSGWTLTNGEYRPIAITREPSGMFWGRSAVLGLDLCWDEGNLRLYDTVAGEYLRSQLEEKYGRLAEREQREAAEAQQEDELKRRLAAEAELQRLRERLMRGGGL